MRGMSSWSVIVLNWRCSGNLQMTLPQSRFLSPGQLVWHYNASWQYSVKSSYETSFVLKMNWVVWLKSMGGCSHREKKKKFWWKLALRSGYGEVIINRGTLKRWSTWRMGIQSYIKRSMFQSMIFEQCGTSLDRFCSSLFSRRSGNSESGKRGMGMGNGSVCLSVPLCGCVMFTFLTK